LYIDKSILIKQEDIAMINIHVAKNIVWKFLMQK
jgi:hypothetical protein